MGRKSKTQQLIESSLGQHLALSVAAHLARTQLVPDPLQVYDGHHMAEMLDVVANALARVAPVYAHEPRAEAPRQLMEAELEGARVKRGATILALKDGRTLSAVSMKRADLRQAIAILKAVGIQELTRVPRAEEPTAESANHRAKLCARFTEVEALLQAPLVATQVDKANGIMVSIARDSPQGVVANLAMQLMSEVLEARGADRLPDSARLLLARLRTALDETANSHQ